MIISKNLRIFIHPYSWNIQCPYCIELQLRTNHIHPVSDRCSRYPPEVQVGILIVMQAVSHVNLTSLPTWNTAHIAGNLWRAGTGTGQRQRQIQRQRQTFPHGTYHTFIKRATWSFHCEFYQISCQGPGFAHLLGPFFSTIDPICWDEKMEENLQGRILGLQCLTQQVGRVTARDLRGDWGDLWAPGGTPPSETTLCCAAEDL